MCVLSGIRSNCGSQDGGCESQQRAHRLADPSVRPPHHRRGHVLHHWPGVLLLSGSGQHEVCAAGWLAAHRGVRKRDRADRGRGSDTGAGRVI